MVYLEHRRDPNKCFFYEERIFKSNSFQYFIAHSLFFVSHSIFHCLSKRTRVFGFKMSRACFKSFIITFVFTVQTANCQSIGNKSEARFVPPPPPFAPPLLYPVNAATGILVAIAVPVLLPDHNVFVSYNFEANYNMPNVPADSVPGPLVRVKYFSQNLKREFYNLNI